MLPAAVTKVTFLSLFPSFAVSRAGATIDFMATRAGRKLTYEDYAAFPDDGIRREIVDGEIYVTPSANTRHQDLAGYVFNALYNHVREHGGGRVFVAALDVLLSEHDIVQPDVVFVAEQSLDVITEAHIRGSPTMAVEVVSDPRHDRVRKRRLYEQARIPIYWIVDPDADRVEVYRADARGRYGKPTLYEVGDTLELEFLPGLEIDITDLFAC